jgi:hypothetical protein
MMAVLIMVGGCSDVDSKQLVRSVPMGSGSFEIRTDGAWVFDSHTVYFYYRGEHGLDLLGSTELANDGANIGDANVTLLDLGDGNWQMTLRGEEQADERWLIKTTGLDLLRLD